MFNQHKQVLAEQRKQNRKISHSVIERRRRERTNQCLGKLKDLVPSCSVQPNQNIQKLTIMELTIDYILELQEELRILKNEPAFNLPMAPLSPTLSNDSHNDNESDGSSSRDERMEIANLLC
ncbi:Myc-type, basic helix-loop-helix domain-containing protein [Globomyces pollinis-pini]|nr:Myc-type, basic helix-loop-helix domain-containing protein [Globomyces pollinis-pini]KAJ2993594.1 hypothetical protein HDV02_002224 [Globomyces sp. JEL0801]